MATGLQKLDMNELHRDLDRCYRADGTVDLLIYLQGYRSLLRFFRLLGRIFSFVANDMESKIIILENLLNSSNGDRYETIHSMVEFETQSSNSNNEGGGSSSSEPSVGCRTLLRLHWAIEFIIAFLEKVKELGDEEKTCPACQETYKVTLGRHHPWIIQKGALIAMHTLPTTRALVQQTCIQSVEEVRKALPKILDGGQLIYKSVQKLYEDNDLLDLP